jgi:hypothetical protein
MHPLTVFHGGFAEHLVHVYASAKSFPGPFEQDSSNGGIVIKFQQGFVQFKRHGATESIKVVRSI